MLYVQRDHFAVHLQLTLLLLSRVGRVRLCETPETAAHQAPPPWDSPGKNAGVGCHAPLHIHAAAKSLRSCPTLRDPTDSSPPVSPSLGFSRQEHWSGLPFPSPVHESEK